MRLANLLFPALAFGLTACGGMHPGDFAAGQPPMVIERFFAGTTRGTGLFEDRFGTVKRQMVVDIQGRWDEPAQMLTLDEQFTFSDGEKQQRVWHIHKLGPDRYEGTAGDVIGVATGESAGNAFHWNYDLDLKTGDSTIAVHLDDWMFLAPDGVVLNRSYMSKLGLDVGSITFAFRKA
ncbi:MAG: hypothetical protein JWO51_1839 [Rhodospirillales bacterium]|nr:hypothetical protein [Rhodospirillales bacterium]